MSTKKLTPGPWVTYRGHTWVSGKGQKIWKSTVIRPIVNGRVSQITLAKCDNEENARLMAAAPDLLEALWAMVTSFHAVEYMQPHMKESASMARAAIAKATGGLD